MFIQNEKRFDFIMMLVIMMRSDCNSNSCMNELLHHRNYKWKQTLLLVRITLKLYLFFLEMVLCFVIYGNWSLKESRYFIGFKEVLSMKLMNPHTCSIYFCTKSLYFTDLSIRRLNSSITTFLKS